MIRIRLFPWLSLFICAVIVSCQARSAPPLVGRSGTLLPTLAATAVPVSPTPAPSATPTQVPATATPTEPPSTPTAQVELPPGVSLPDLLLVADNSIIQQNGSDRQTIVEIPEVGNIFSSVQGKEKVFLLTSTGLHWADLRTGSFETITTFESTLLTGSLLTDPNDNILVASVTRAGNPIEQGRLFSYDIERNVLKEVMERPGFSLVPLVIDTEQTLSFVARSGDPSFAFIEQVSLATGKESEIFVDSSWDIAFLSPQGRYYAAVGLAPSESPELPNRYGIWLKDLSISQTDQTWIDLPLYPSQPTGMLWSADETSIYTYLQNAPNATFKEAYGLWRLDVKTRQMEQVAELDAAWVRPAAISPDGAWIILQPETETLIYLVHPPSGTVVQQPVPNGSRLIGFKK